MTTTKTKPALPGLTIFGAQRAAQKLATQTRNAHGSVITMPRSELAALAQQLADVSAIAADYHLERMRRVIGDAGSLAPEAFPGAAE